MSENQKAVRGRDGRLPPWSVPVTFFKMDLIAAVTAGVFEAGARCCWSFRWCGPGLRTFRLGDNFFRHAPRVDSSSCRGPGRLFLLPAASPSLPAPSEQDSRGRKQS